MVDEFSFFKKRTWVGHLNIILAPGQEFEGVQIPVRKEVEVSNWSIHKHEICLSTYFSP